MADRPDDPEHRIDTQVTPPTQSQPPETDVAATSCANVPRELIDHPVYEVVKELGRGGMGVVYLARHRLMGRLDVLKVMQDRFAGQPDHLRRFENEIKLAGRLQHPNVVTAYGAFPAGNALVLAMEYVDGHSLQQVVKRDGPLSVQRACDLARQVALGLQGAHERRMVHRDIKPDNVMVTGRGEVKILDFGLAKAVSEDGAAGLTRTHDAFGTPEYMAPEQAMNARSADIRADLYSLGGTLYFLLTGRPPFGTGSPYALMHAHQTQPIPRLPSSCPGDLMGLLKKMMAKRRDDRPQTPGEVAEALARIGAGQMPLTGAHAASSGETIENSIGMKLVRIPAGAFWMGSPRSEEGREEDEHQHEVEITQEFYLGVYPVTQAQWKALMGKNPSWFRRGGGGEAHVAGLDTSGFPVECVSWHEAVEFCHRLTRKEGFTHRYRLPTEAEWEYACRGGGDPGTYQVFHFGHSLRSTQANFDGHHPYGAAAPGPYLGRTCEVGSYPANALGLHDLHGNVWEWCSDWYFWEYYRKSEGAKDPSGPTGGSGRVIRGGSWCSSGESCRSAYRYGDDPSSNFNNDFGLRVVRVPSNH